jgi:hypothetical protein
VLNIYLFAMLLYWIMSLVTPGGYAPGSRLPAQLCEPDIEAGAPPDSADRTCRFFDALGVDRDRRPVDSLLR